MTIDSRNLIWFLGVVACASSLESDSNSPSLYERDLWGRWVDLDKDCQDTRAEVLIRDSRVEVTFADGKTCRVIGGEWVDPYTDAVFTDASLVDIDHIVPLEEAHFSGGWLWDTSKKRQFFNYEANLVATGRSSNRSKGSRPPEAWLPSVNRCQYLSTWVLVKKNWDLSFDLAEQAILNYMTTICERGEVPPLPQKGV